MSLPEIKVTGRVLTLSQSTLKRNPNLGGGSVSPQCRDQRVPGKESLVDLAASSAVGARPSRIRQSAKPILNHLEQDWYDRIKDQYPNYPPIRKQSKRFRIGNGAWYKPDLTCSIYPVAGGPARETAWECKGPKQMKNIARGILTLKTAATQWPEVRFVLVWRELGEWKEQEVLP